MVSSGCGGGRAVARAARVLVRGRAGSALPSLGSFGGLAVSLACLACGGGSRVGASAAVVWVLVWLSHWDGAYGVAIKRSQSPCAVTSDPTMSIWSTEGLYRAESLIAASAPKPMMRMV